MKKLFFFAFTCLLGLTVMAQRCEVVDFYVNDDLLVDSPMEQFAYVPAAIDQSEAEYVDLGLPSGTKWKSQNEQGFYTYNRAVNTFMGKVPQKWQWQELMSYCEWQWTAAGYKVVSRNGNSIFLPLTGRLDDDDLDYTDCGFYWSATEYKNSNWSAAWTFQFSWNDLDLDWVVAESQRAVRLVRNY